jgi:hypothetical protein
MSVETVAESHRKDCVSMREALREGGVVADERKGDDRLIMEVLESPATACDGVPRRGMLTHRWYDPKTAGVMGEERTFWSLKEVRNAVKSGLFNAFQLF